MVLLLTLFCFVALIASKLLQSGRWGWSLGHFTSYLARIVSRNLPLGRAIDNYAADLPWFGNLARRTMLRTIAERVDNGQPLSEVMACYPATFPAAYRALVRAGERSGSLGSILARLRRLAELDESTARRGAAAVVYPLALAMLISGVGGLIGVFIIPKLFTMFHEMGIDRKNTFDLMFLAGSLGPLMLLALMAFAIFFGLWPVVAYAGDRLAPRLAAFAARLRWHLPLLGRYERRRAAGQYALAAGQLLGAGLPVPEALEIAAAASDNPRFEWLAVTAAMHVAEGQPLSAALSAADRRGELPPELLWHVGLGEAGSDLPAALDRAAESAFARGQAILQGLLDMIFPIGVVAIGLTVGLMAYSLFATLAAAVEGVG